MTLASAFELPTVCAMTFVLVGAGRVAMSVSPASRTPSAFSAISVAIDARRRSRTRERTAWMRVRV